MASDDLNACLRNQLPYAGNSLAAGHGLGDSLLLWTASFFHDSKQ